MRINIFVFLLACLMCAHLSAQSPDANKKGLVDEVAAIDFRGSAKRHIDPKSGAVVPFAGAKPGTKGAICWAYDKESEILAAVFPEDGLLKTFHGAVNNSDGRVSSQVEIERTSNLVFHKVVGEYSVFVVLSPSKGSIQVFDVRTLELIGESRVKSDRSLEISIQRSSDTPFIYFLCKMNKNGAKGLNRFDLRRLPEIPQVDVSKSIEKVTAFAFTPDHKNIYYSLYSVPFSGVHYGKVKEHKDKGFTLESEHFQQCQLPNYIEVDPDGRFVCFNGKAHTLDMKVEIFRPAYGQFGNMRKSGLRAGIDRRSQEVFFSYINNPQRGFGKVRIKGLPIVDKPDPRHFMGWLCVFQSQEPDRLILCAGSVVVVTSQSELRLPDVPLLAFAVKGKKDFEVGKAGMWQLENYGSDGEFSLLKGPAGMAVEGDKLVWNASPHQIGLHVVEVALKKGAFSTKVSFILNAERSSLKLPFDVSRGVISREGDLLLTIRDVSASGGLEASSNLCLVDLLKQRIIGEKHIAAQVGYVALNKDFIVLWKQGLSELSILKVEDFSVVKLFAVEGRVTRAHFVDNETLLLVDNRRRLISLKDFKPIRKGIHFDLFNIDDEQSGHSRTTRERGESWIAGGFIHNGYFMNSQGKMRQTTIMPEWAVTMERYRAEGGSRVSRGREAYENRYDGLNTWGVRLKEGTRQSNRYRHRPEYKGIVLASTPMAASLELSLDTLSPELLAIERLETHHLELRFRSLVGNNAVRPLVIGKYVHRESRGGERYVRTASQIFEVGNKIAVLFHAKIYFIEIPEFTAKEARVPMVFEMK